MLFWKLFVRFQWIVSILKKKNRKKNRGEKVVVIYRIIALIQLSFIVILV